MKMLAFVFACGLACFGNPIGIISLSLLGIIALPYYSVTKEI